MHNFIGAVFLFLGVLLIGYTFLHSNIYNDLGGKIIFQLSQIKGVILIVGGLLIAFLGDISKYTKKLLQEKEKESTKEKEKE